MKYFKPELLAQCRSCDEDIADAAARDWDAATAAYRARFKGIRDQMPAGVRRLASKFSLHDAKFLGVAIGKKKPLFGILVELEGATGQGGEVLELNYHSVAGPNGGIHFRSHPLSSNGARGNVQVLYHEFDIDEEHAFFTHTLLLSDDREIEVRFHHLTIRQVGAVYTPMELTERDVTWPVAESVA